MVILTAVQSLLTTVAGQIFRPSQVLGRMMSETEDTVRYL